jgi:hypothetical protein
MRINERQSAFEPVKILECYPNTFYDRCPPNRIDYEPSTWRASVRAVHDKQVPGNHNTCVTTFAGVVANELQKIISGRSCSPECDSAPR